MMRQYVLLGTIFVLALVSLCPIMISDDSSADGNPAVYVECNGEKVGNAESYGWSVSETYASKTYTLVMSDDTEISGEEEKTYEWRTDSGPVSSERTFDISNCVQSGTYKAYIDSEWKGDVHIVISKANASLTINDQEITYGGKISSEKTDVEVEGLCGDDDLYSIGLYSDNSTPGTYDDGIRYYSDKTVIKNGNADVTSNYIITVSEYGTLTINKKAVTIASKTQEITYGEDIKDTEDQVDKGELVTGHDLGDFTLEAYSLEVVDNNYILISDVSILDENDNPVTDNYVITLEYGKLTVNQKPLTITAKDKAINYGDDLGGVGDVTCDGLIDGHELISITLKAGSDSGLPGVGTYDLTPSGASIEYNSENVTNNYVITYESGTLTVSVRDVTLDVSETTITYNASTDQEIHVQTGINDEYLIWKVQLTHSEVGTYEYDKVYPDHGYSGDKLVDGTGLKNNYKVTLGSKGNIIIEKRELSIVAEDQIITYGEDIEKSVDVVTCFNLVTGHKLGDDFTLEATSLYVDDENEIEINKESVKIIIKTSEEDVTKNYNITCENGTLTVQKKGITITAKDQSITYGESISSGPTQGEADGLVNNDTLLSIILTPSTSDVTESGYITPSEPKFIDETSRDVTGCYLVTATNTGLLTISTYEQSFDVSVAPYQYNGKGTLILEYETDLHETLNLVITLTNTDKGTYAFASGGYTVEWTDGTGKVTNYSLTIDNYGDIQIDKAEISINIVARDFVYDGSMDRYPIYDTGVNDETLKVHITFNGSHVAEYDSSKYQLVEWTDGTGRASNYEVTTPITETLSIVKLEITRVLEPGSIPYDASTKEKYAFIYGINKETLKIKCTAYSSSCGTYQYSSTAGEGMYTLSEWEDGEEGHVGDYIINISDRGPLFIEARSISITASAQEITYSEDIGRTTAYIEPVSGLVDGHQVLGITLTESSLHAGINSITPSAVSIFDEDGNDVSSNYLPSYNDGKLTVKKLKADVDIPQIDHEYGGTNVFDIDVSTGYLTETLKIQVTLSSKDVGTYTHDDEGNHYAISGQWEDGTGLASDYIVTITSYGAISVIQKKVTLAVPTMCIFEYTGESVFSRDVSTGTADEYLVLVLTTSSPNVDVYDCYDEKKTVPNYYVCEWQDSSSGKVSNYNITTRTDNQVIISQKSATIRVQTEKIYDGSVLVYNLTENDVQGLVSSDKFISGTLKTTSKESGTYTSGYDSIVTQNGSSNYDFKQEVNLVINKRDITVTSGTLSAVDGMFTGALVYEAIASVGGMGYVDGEELDYDFTGSQITVGSSLNTFSCKDSTTALLGNYNVTYVFGTLKVISKNDVTTKAETDSNILSEQIQADLAACAEYNKSIGKVQLVEITTTASELSMSAEFIRDITMDDSAPVSISTYYGRIILTNEIASSALSEASQFKVSIVNKEKSSSNYALEYSINLTADEKEIHSLGASTKVTFFIDPSKVFPVNRTMKIVAVESGEKFDAEYDGNTGELSFNTDHLSDYGVTMEENVGGPSFTAVIVVIIVCAVLAIATGVLIRYLKKNFYI